MEGGSRWRWWEGNSLRVGMGSCFSVLGKCLFLCHIQWVIVAHRNLCYTFSMLRAHDFCSFFYFSSLPVGLLKTEGNGHTPVLGSVCWQFLCMPHPPFPGHDHWHPCSPFQGDLNPTPALGKHPLQPYTSF